MQNTYFVNTGNHCFQVAEWSDGKYPIVGIHGLTGNMYTLRALGEEFSPNYRFITYDLRGRGDSSPAESDSTYETHAQDLIEMLPVMKAENPFLIGYSLGAFIAAQAASKYRDVKGLVMLDGGGDIPEGHRENLKVIMKRLERSFSSKDEYISYTKLAYEAMGVDWTEYLKTSVLYEIQRDEGSGFRYKGRRDSVGSDLESIFYYDHEAVFPQIKCPVLLVYASTEKDPAAHYLKEEAYNKAKVLIPNLEFYVAGCNHQTLVMNKQPELVDVIKKFLSRCQTNSN